VLSYGARVTFYDVQPDGSPNFADLQAKIDRHTRAILALHYFGFPQPMRRLAALCAEHHLYLIEDCAHVLKGEGDAGPLGASGDISIYSWRKFLPLYDGGQLVVNNPELPAEIAWQNAPWLFELKAAKNLADKLIDDSTSALVKTAYRCFRHLPAMLTRAPGAVENRQSTVLAINNHSSDFDPALVNMPMSRLSRRILQQADITPIIRQRQHNYTYLLDAIQALPEVTPWFRQLPKDVCPLAFPMTVRGQADFHLVLRARGIPATTWGGVRHPALPKEVFPNADYLYQNLIALPIHQSLSSADMQTMVQVLAEAIHQRKKG
jgi:dTDP-4-amino-4,6-dideoxygalactose transaminase